MLSRETAQEKFEDTFKREVSNEEYEILETIVEEKEEGWYIRRHYVKGAILYSLGEFFPYDEREYFKSHDSYERVVQTRSIDRTLTNPMTNKEFINLLLKHVVDLGSSDDSEDFEDLGSSDDSEE